MNATTHAAGTCDTDALNSLLRGELSAVETYDQAMTKFDGQPTQTDLRRIREQHAAAAATLRQKVTHFGGKPSESSGAWGAFATAVTGAAKVFGPATALSALKQGEEHGIGEYEDALTNEQIDPGCKDVIRSQLLPECRRHVDTLDRLIGGMK